MGSIPDWGTKIPHAVWCGQKKKENQIVWTQMRQTTAEVGPGGGRNTISFSFSTFYAKKKIAVSSGLEVQKECVSSYKLKEKETLEVTEKDLIRKEAVFRV